MVEVQFMSEVDIIYPYIVIGGNYPKLWSLNSHGSTHKVASGLHPWEVIEK